MGKLLRTAFQRMVVATLQFGNARCIDIKTDGGPLLTELNGERQAYVAQANDGNSFMLGVHFFVFASRALRSNHQFQP